MIRSDKFKPQKLRLSRRFENSPFTRKDELVLDIIMMMSIIVSFYNGRRTNTATRSFVGPEKTDD